MAVGLTGEQQIQSALMDSGEMRFASAREIAKIVRYMSPILHRPGSLSSLVENVLFYMLMQVCLIN